MVRKFESPCYCTNARRLANILTEHYNRKLAPVGVNTAQFCLLRNLSRLGQANLTAWAEKTGIDRTTMVRNAKVLSAKGVIRLAEGSRRDYCLSPLGEAVLEDGALLWDEAQADIERVLGKDGASFLLRIGKAIQSLE